MTESTDVTLSRVMASEKDVLRRLLSDYLVEFAEMQGVAVTKGSDGFPAYRWFHDYWTDQTRIPFFITAHGKIAGLCLVRRLDKGWAIAEFGVTSRWRKQRVGTAAVELLAREASASGASSLLADVHDWNTAALAFWTSCGFNLLRETNGVIETERVVE